MQAATGNTVTMAQAAINSLTDTINQGYDNWLSRTKFLEKEFSSLHKEIFKYITDGPIKADFWRLCVLYKNSYFIVSTNQTTVPKQDKSLLDGFKKILN
jgi:hypothetical protein